MLFSGTVPVLKAVEPGMRDFSMALRDPVLGRAMTASFHVADITDPATTEG
jgi:hypothetical protein